MRQRLLRLYARHRDLIQAGAIGAAWCGLTQVALETHRWYPAWLAMYWWAGLFLMVAVALRHSHPTLALWLTVLVYPAGYRVGLQTDAHVVPLMVACYSATRYAAKRLWVVAAAASFAVFALLTQGGPRAGWRWDIEYVTWSLSPHVSRLTLLVAAVTAAAFVGENVRRLHVARSELLERNAELSALQDLRERAAVIAERTRIARDLHDVVAHHVAAIVMRSQALARREGPDEAEDRVAMSWIAETGRDALRAMRSVVSVLGGERGLLAPQPTLADLPNIASGLQEAGLSVDYLPPEDIPECGSEVELALVRIAQEALTNVLLHSTAPLAKLELSFDPAATWVTLVVSDPGPAAVAVAGDFAGGGNGLVNMRERARAAGGQLDVSDHGPQGWTVRAEIPIGAR
jgi:signal transduction histidine kinase